MTDQELKIELCKLLPEEIESYVYCRESHDFVWLISTKLIRETEWLEVCHRIEKILPEIKNGAANFIINLHGVTNAMDAESTAEELWRISQATWQQRAEALIKTFKEIKT